LFVHSDNDLIIAGTLLHNSETIDAGMKAALKISTNIKPRLLGMGGLKAIIEKTRWNLDCVIEGNPRYLIFSLVKNINNLTEKKY
jgi:hypothetical protein